MPASAMSAGLTEKSSSFRFPPSPTVAAFKSFTNEDADLIGLNCTPKKNVWLPFTHVASSRNVGVSTTRLCVSIPGKGLLKVLKVNLVGNVGRKAFGKLRTE